MLRRLTFLPLLIAGLAMGAGAQSAETRPWPEIVAAAEGQTVYWNAWGGDERVNAYIAWVGDQLREHYDVSLVHVKLADTADAVSRVLAERTAGKKEGGSVDLIWINGENFAAMKQQHLLYGPFTQVLPNFRLVDFEDKPSTLVDFTVPTEGYESPWGMAKLNFIYDSARVTETPGSIPALLTWAEANPGRPIPAGMPPYNDENMIMLAAAARVAHRARLVQRQAERDVGQAGQRQGERDHHGGPLSNPQVCLVCGTLTAGQQPGGPPGGAARRRHGASMAGR